MEQTDYGFLMKKVLVLVFIFILFFMNSLELGSCSFVLTNETDHQALLAIKNRISEDPLSALSSWNHSVHFCNWQGVTCSNRHQRAIRLNLSSLRLVGSLSPHIGNLSFLRIIDLTNNTFRGNIPPEIGKLSRLKYLSLANNSFRGEFPTNLTHCLDLRAIYALNNHLEGKIPTEISSLSKLWILNLAVNHLTGTIPPSIGNLSKLLELSLAYNSLQGSIPLELVQLSKLEFISLSANNLSGTVPSLLYNISSIGVISLVDNLLHGTLPPDLGLTLPKLELLQLAYNQFSGTIPYSIANASELGGIGLSRNFFTGPLPMSLGNLSKLEKLVSWGNELGDGSRDGNELINFLTSLSNCSNLQYLDLAANGFVSSLPPSIANLSTKLTWFTLDVNYISGSIPFGIGNLLSLRRFSLETNVITGGIPNAIGKLSKLEKLYIGGNNISGEIPSSIGNLTGLGLLQLSDNVIEGSLPVSLGSCTNLQRIHLENNHLTGAIPQELFGLSSLIFLYLNQNYLTGLLPLQFGNLKNLEILDVSENKLSGEIPATLGSCQVLESLYMQSNLFNGSIPATFELLKGMQVLDISRNNLSGQIPMFLGKLRFLHNLNLSHNMFHGVVPNEGVFTNITAFSVVGNNKLCGGIEVLQLPACAVKGKRYLNRVVIALVVTLPIVLLLVCFLAILYRIRSPAATQPNSSPSSAQPFQNQYLQLSYRELFQATDGFTSANLIGRGRYSSVFKGTLNSGEQLVAVKVLNLQERGANKSFVTEYKALKGIRHRNLVKIITTCSSIDFKGNDFKALVLEFMENGSLESWLHTREQGSKRLNFVERLDIAIDVASALDYLHHHCQRAVIHCDLKPSNVLLDDNLCAHVGDFGITRILSDTTTVSNYEQSSSIGVKGTIGYVAPEYGMGEEVSTRGDMYSYGVLLLEMFTGKTPTDSMFIDDINLQNYVKMTLPNRVMEIVDPRITLDEEEGEGVSSSNISKMEICLVSVFQIAVSCSAEVPSERMNAREVLVELHKIKNA